MLMENDAPMQLKFLSRKHLYNPDMKGRIVLYIACLLMPASLAVAEDGARRDLPVILLTGFEPFGEGRPPNPSWEGIKALDGQVWREHKLVAQRLPVVWGSPQKHLEPWLTDLKPVAVFSFGQGGGYRLETMADNRRGDGHDNDGRLPGERKIFADGADRLASSIDAPALSKLLMQRGYDVPLSREAGNYLCEECLYTLEYLKQRDKLSATVLFCHVPPLAPGRYEAADVEKFVLTMLDAWSEIYHVRP